MKDLKPDEGKEKQDTNLLTQDVAVVSLKDNNNNKKKLLWNFAENRK